MIFTSISPHGKSLVLNYQRQRILVSLVYICTVFSAAVSKAEANPTLYVHWRPGADAYDSFTLTVNLVVDQTTPNGTYSIRSEQTTNSSNFANHVFTVTNGVASVNSFTVLSYPLFGNGPTGILLWVNDEPTNEFATVTQIYHYTDGGNEPDYFSHHNNPQLNYMDAVTFKLDATANQSLETVQAVPEPATWIFGAVTGSAVVIVAHRRRRRRSRGPINGIRAEGRHSFVPDLIEVENSEALNRSSFTKAKADR